MRNFIIIFVFTLFTFGVFAYLADVLNPFAVSAVETLATQNGLTNDQEVYQYLVSARERGVITTYLAMDNVIVLVSVFLLAIAGAFTFLHLLVDRLWISKFYRPPRLGLAIRRSSLLVIFIGIAFFYHLLAASVWLTLVTGLLLFVVELIITKAVRDYKSRDAAGEEQTNDST